MLYLILSMLDLSSSDTLAHAASHIGVASSFATLLRALPFHASQRRMVIPVDLTSKNGVREEEVYRIGGNAEGISDAVFDFATVANDHLLTARQLFKESGGKVPAEAMPVFLSAVSLLPTALDRKTVLNPCWVSHRFRSHPSSSTSKRSTLTPSTLRCRSEIGRILGGYGELIVRDLFNIPGHFSLVIHETSAGATRLLRLLENRCIHGKYN